MDFIVKGRDKGTTVQAWTGLSGFYEVEVHRFHGSLRIKVARLSALQTDRLYPQINIPGTHFC
jgi:hypothetical protein